MLINFRATADNRVSRVAQVSTPARLKREFSLEDETSTVTSATTSDSEQDIKPVVPRSPKKKQRVKDVLKTEREATGPKRDFDASHSETNGNSKLGSDATNENHKTSSSGSVADPHLLQLVASVHSHWPNLTLPLLIDLCTSLQANSSLLGQSTLSPNGVTRDSSLGTLTRLLLRPPSSLSALQPASTSLPSKHEPSNIILQLSLHLSTSSPPSSSIPRPLASPQAIHTPHSTCSICTFPLRIRRSPHTVHLLSPSLVRLGVVVAYTCSNKACEALHYPDRVTIRCDDDGDDGISSGGKKSKRILIDRFTEDAEWIRLGRKLYASRSFAVEYEAALEAHRASLNSWTDVFNSLHFPYSSTSSRLRPEQLWRAYVVHNALSLAKESGKPLLTVAEASTEEIIRMCLDEYRMGQGAVVGGLEHSCPECSRYGRIWKLGRERSGDEEWMRGKVNTTVYEEDTVVDRSRIVKLVVMDGIKIGHQKCAHPLCQASPLSHRNRTTGRFCSEHEHYLQLCGVYGCEKPLLLGKKEGSCGSEEHEELWAKWKRRNAGWCSGGKSSVVLESKKDDTEEIDHVVLGDKQFTMWSNGRVAGIQLLVWSCGTIIGWQKFYTAETPDEVFDFLSAITPPNNSSQSPTHIAYDRSCTLLRHVLRSPSHQRWSPLQGGPQFIVDAWHFAGHSKNDRVCRECCDPDQGQDLVVPFVEKRARKRWERGGKKEAEVPERRWKRCFNTEAAEQLNAWLRGFAPLLKSMTAENHDFLLSLLLRRRFEKRSEALKVRHGGERVG